MSDEIERVILDHYHDEEQGLYRVVVGYAVETELLVVDDATGEPVELPPVELTDEDGNVVREQIIVEEQPDPEECALCGGEGEITPMGEDGAAAGEKMTCPDCGGEGTIPQLPVSRVEEGDPIMVPGGQQTIPVKMIVDTDDVVFAADDERWEGKSDEEIARIQREIVADAIDTMFRGAEEKAAREAAGRRTMPGAGETL